MGTQKERGWEMLGIPLTFVGLLIGIISIIGGIVILIRPLLLSYIVAAALIIMGIVVVLYAVS